MACYSTAKKGQFSRIVSRLPEGTMVTTPRMDTDYLCTEYGLVKIQGKTTRERALAIISIAQGPYIWEVRVKANEVLSELRKF